MAKDSHHPDYNEHPLRRVLNDELHARKFNNFAGTGRFIRYVYFTQGDDRKLLADINKLLVSLDLRKMAEDEKFIRLDSAEFAVRVERHTEFMSLSLIDVDAKTKIGVDAAGFDQRAYPHLPFAQIKKITHPVFHATWLEIRKSPKQRPSFEDMEVALDGRSVAGDVISSGGGQLYASFDIDQNGYSRMALMNDSIADYRMGRVIQRVIEMETYRLMALLSLPKVKYHAPSLDRVEASLREATFNLAQLHKADDQTAAQTVGQADQLLSQLTRLAADIEQIYSETSYRFAASLAYQEIISARISSLKPSRLDGFQSIGGFLDKRMMPAIQSVKSFSVRMEQLSVRIARAGQLQRSQTEMALQKQNRDLLASMDKRAFAQLRLQQTVEGLSIAALTYYGVGLIGYMADGVALGGETKLIKAVAVPLVAGVAFFMIRRVRHVLAGRNHQD